MQYNFNLQKLNQSNIKTLCENKDITSLAIKRYKHNAWIYCFNLNQLIGISKKYTHKQADKFYDKMVKKYKV